MEHTVEQQTFDIETGMAVYGANGQIIGTVAEIAGFGSTRIDPAPGSVGAQVTQAQSGTGYLKIERPGREDIYVPFHGIDEVIPGHGVNLTATMLDELRRGVDTLPRQADVTAQPQQPAWPLTQRRRWNLPQPRRWQVWRPRTWALGRSERKAATAALDVERGES